jgi:hypothetical protein
MYSVPTLRRVIRGYRNLKAFTGYGPTRTRELMKLGRHPLPIKGQRACSWFEDEIAAMQAELAEQRDAAAQAKAERQTGDGEPRKFRRRRPRSAIHDRGH